MPNTIRAYLNGEGFDDQQIAAMDRAYQEATSVLQVRPDAPSIVHKVIAARLIEAAQGGEHNPHELCRRALGALKA